MTVRLLSLKDYDDALVLYRDLVGDISVIDGADGEKQFAALLAHPGTRLIGATLDSRVVSMLTLHLLPNMTFSGRPYGLIENVVTLSEFQGRGFGRSVVQSAVETAWSENAYKVMLLSGKSFASKGFYEKLGFSADDKHGMILRRAPNRRPKR